MIRHESQRGWFAYSLFEEMKRNPDIWLICIDLGYNVFNAHFEAFPDRVTNTGAAEQTAMDIAIGLALQNKIPFVYSITPFLLFRPFEAIKLYINHENIPVKLIGSGRNHDYHVDGESHNAEDDKKFLFHLSSIKSFWPKSREEIPELVKTAIYDRSPYYINLTK